MAESKHLACKEVNRKRKTDKILTCLMTFGCIQVALLLRLSYPPARLCLSRTTFLFLKRKLATARLTTIYVLHDAMLYNVIPTCLSIRRQNCELKHFKNKFTVPEGHYHSCL